MSSVEDSSAAAAGRSSPAVGFAPAPEAFCVALGVPSRAGMRARRCMQRATLLSTASRGASTRDWMALPLHGSLLIRYLIARPPNASAEERAALDAEQHAHGDLLLTASFPDAPWACG
eukprot:3370462-Prymnesium_polylepis.1